MLDFHLRHLQDVESPVERVHVLILYKNDLAELEQLEFQVSSVAGDVAAGSIPKSRMDELMQHPGVSVVEASRPLKDETDVSAVEINLVDRVTLMRNIPGGGHNAIIGIIDSGFDLTHPCFRLFPTDLTRVLAAWDQTDTKGGPPPHGFTYGVEFTRDEIQKHITAGEIRTNGGGHGTNVACIAAGNGEEDGIFKGMAPNAGLIFVTYRNDVPIGGSAFVVDAINYIRRKATAFDRPVVINISQGDQLGPHDGSSLLERAIDNVVSAGRTLVVKSAGNAAGQHEAGTHHAHGQVSAGYDFNLPFDLNGKTLNGKTAIKGDAIELWYDGNDLLSVALQPPTGSATKFIEAGKSGTLDLPNNTKASVYSDLKHPINGHNRIGIVFHDSPDWESGRWKLILCGQKVVNGEFDAWVDRPNGKTRIAFKEHNSDSGTITIPGNAHRVITVGGFVSRPTHGGETGEVKGTLAAGSSRGPTRDGRLKPDIAAPSTLISVADSRNPKCSPRYSFQRGTSMSAPHVTGAIALLWGLWPELTSHEIQRVLFRTARKDQFTGPSANFRWGHGKLDIGAAYKFFQSQTELETKSMPKKTCEFQLTLKGHKGTKNMTVQIDIEDGKAVAIRGLNEEGADVYEVQISIRKKSGKKGGDECWACVKPNSPCPPYELQQVECPGNSGP